MEAAEPRSPSPRTAVNLHLLSETACMHKACTMNNIPLQHTRASGTLATRAGGCKDNLVNGKLWENEK